MWPAPAGAAPPCVSISDHRAHQIHAFLVPNGHLHDAEDVDDGPPLVVLDAYPHALVQHLIATEAVQDDQGALAPRPILVVGLTASGAHDPANQVPGLIEIHKCDALLAFGLRHPTRTFLAVSTCSRRGRMLPLHDLPTRLPALMCLGARTPMRRSPRGVDSLGLR